MWWGAGKQVSKNQQYFTLIRWEGPHGYLLKNLVISGCHSRRHLHLVFLLEKSAMIIILVSGLTFIISLSRLSRRDSVVTGSLVAGLSDSMNMTDKFLRG